MERACAERGAEPETIRRLRQILESCDRARYQGAEAGQDSDEDEILEQADALLHRLDTLFSERGRKAR